MSSRSCSRNNCRRPAVATLTYVYATSTAVVGPLAVAAEPHTYDLCEAHARGLTAPRGWQLVRNSGELGPPERFPDDLVALAEAVRERPIRGVTAQPREVEPDDGGPATPTAQRGHLRLVPPS